MKTRSTIFCLALLMLISGCKPWYEDEKFEAYYYGLQETALAQNGGFVEAMYFVDLDDVSTENINELRAASCDTTGLNALDCVTISRVASMGSELLFNKVLIGVTGVDSTELSPIAVPADVAVGLPSSRWPPPPDSIMAGYRRFVCPFRSVIQDSIPGYIAETGIESYLILQLYADSIPVDSEYELPEIRADIIPATGSAPKFWRIYATGGPCNVAFPFAC